MNNTLKTIFAILAAALLLVLVLRFVEKERPANDLERGINKAADKVQEAVDDTGRKIEDAVD